MAVFADPDCPYCQRLEQELQSVQDVTVYTFLFPIVDLHPDARTHAEQIWCSADAPASWAHWMLDRKAPAADTKCAESPVGKLVALGERLKIDATPTMFTADGNRYVGLPDVTQLEARLTAGLAAKKPTLSQ
jgi:thiol:disulfide interchange protein DsbC